MPIKTRKIHTGDFVVPSGKPVHLNRWPTNIRPVYRSQDEYQTILDAHIRKLSDWQDLLYASASHSLLLIFQAMDAAGKDSMIRHVMSGINPQGCQVFSFKQPGAEELAHDFLWDATRKLPERGRIGIFNRSYYEEVLIVRVHPELLKDRRIPVQHGTLDSLWDDRYQSIVNLEKHLDRNGTRVLKFFLHLSKEEQRKRFLHRIDEPGKNWKFSVSDMEERRFWSEYMKAYELCLGATSTRAAPWHVVPADDKQNARLIVSHIVLDAFAKLGLALPKTTPAMRRQLLELRKQLAK